MRRLTIEEFTERAKSIHKDKYDYSKSDYVNVRSKMQIICPSHGCFWQSPRDHMKGVGCPKCGIEKMSSSQSFSKEVFVGRVEKIHKNKYSYDQVIYKNNKSKVEIICPSHGSFWQIPASHEQGRGCKKCGNENTKLITTSRIGEFINKSNKIHEDKYDYSKVEYNNSKCKIEITCLKHGSFFQTPNKHLYGRGCPKCKYSKGEKKISRFLKDNNIPYSHEVSFDNCKDKGKLRFDFQARGRLIEFQGRQHYEAIVFWKGEAGLKDQQYKDQIKRDFCKENDIPLLEIHHNDENWEEKLINFLDIS